MDPGWISKWYQSDPLRMNIFGEQTRRRMARLPHAVSKLLQSSPGFSVVDRVGVIIPGASKLVIFDESSGTEIYLSRVWFPLWLSTMVAKLYWCHQLEISQGHLWMVFGYQKRISTRIISSVWPRKPCHRAVPSLQASATCSLRRRCPWGQPGAAWTWTDEVVELVISAAVQLGRHEISSGSSPQKHGPSKMPRKVPKVTCFSPCVSYPRNLAPTTWLTQKTSMASKKTHLFSASFRHGDQEPHQKTEALPASLGGPESPEVHFVGALVTKKLRT